LVEELTIAPNGKELETSWLRLIINEFDDHSIEQAILLKERGAGHVTVIVPNQKAPMTYFSPLPAKGADQLIKLSGDFGGANSHSLARIYTSLFKELQPDLILTGVQTHNSLDGSLGPLLAESLDVPFVGYVSGVTVTDGKAIVRKEYPGGLIAEMEVSLPAVLGIQAAEQPPRYVAYSKIRQVMSVAKIAERQVVEIDCSGGVDIRRMFQPEVTSRATMIEGSAEEVAAGILGVFKELGVL